MMGLIFGLIAALGGFVAASLAEAQGYSPTGACPTHQWNYAYGSMTNAADCLQPGFGDISGVIGSGQVSGSYTGITGIGTLTTPHATTVAPTSAWGFDGHGQSATVANGASITLAPGIGDLFIADDRNYSAKVLVQNGSVSVYVGNTGIFVASSSPASNQTGLAISGGQVTIYNNTGGSRIYTFGMLRGG